MTYDFHLSYLGVVEVASSNLVGPTSNETAHRIAVGCLV